jgi:hypothetical protein
LLDRVHDRILENLQALPADPAAGDGSVSKAA